METTFEKMAEHCKPTVEHPLAIVLGSGLGALAERVRAVRHIPYSDIEASRPRRFPLRATGTRCSWARSTTCPWWCIPAASICIRLRRP